MTCDSSVISSTTKTNRHDRLILVTYSCFCSVPSMLHLSYISTGSSSLCVRLVSPSKVRGCRGRDHMIAGFTTTCALNAYDQLPYNHHHHIHIQNISERCGLAAFLSGSLISERCGLAAFLSGSLISERCGLAAFLSGSLIT